MLLALNDVFSEVYEMLLALFFNSPNTALVKRATFSSRSTRELCHKMLHHNEGKEHVIHCGNIYIFSLH
jgi:hypothetical protein